MEYPTSTQDLFKVALGLSHDLLKNVVNELEFLIRKAKTVEVRNLEEKSISQKEQSDFMSHTVPLFVDFLAADPVHFSVRQQSLKRAVDYVSLMGDLMNLDPSVQKDVGLLRKGITTISLEPKKLYASSFLAQQAVSQATLYVNLFNQIDQSLTQSPTLPRPPKP